MTLPSAQALPATADAPSTVSTFQSIGRSTAGGYFHGVSVLYDGIRDNLYSPSFRRELQGYNAMQVLKGHIDQAPTDDHVSLVQYADMKTYLPGDILTKVDRASMAHSLEVRVPLLDHHFVEWAGGVQSRMKLRAGEGKYILKKALEPMVPHDTLYRRKMGFAVPISSWFRGALKDRVREALTGNRLAETGYFDTAYLTQLVDQHQSGQREHSAVLWSLLMFDSFLRQVHDAAPPVFEKKPVSVSAPA